jgi:cyclic-di-GMP-binding protein
MAATFSFDIVSDFDRQELVNALDQARRELSARYDLKDTNTEISLEEETITIKTASEFSLTAVNDIVAAKAAKRNLSLKIFDYGKVESISGSRVSQVVTLKKGLDQENAKKISKSIRDNCGKVQPSIQGDAIRVVAKSKDELQGVIQFLKGEDLPLALQFTNYR